MQHEQRPLPVEDTPKSRAAVSSSHDKAEEGPQEDGTCVLSLKTLPGHGFITSTPIFFRKVSSPHHLQLDLEQSSTAEWSASMATPANRGSAILTPLTLPTTGSTTTTEEDSEVGRAFTDDSLVEWRPVMKDRRGRGSARLRPGGCNAVARTLFPVTPLMLTTNSASVPASPLVHHRHHQSQTRTPKDTPGGVTPSLRLRSAGRGGIGQVIDTPGVVVALGLSGRENGGQYSLSQPASSTPSLCTPGAVDEHSRSQPTSSVPKAAGAHPTSQPAPGAVGFVDRHPASQPTTSIPGATKPISEHPMSQPIDGSPSLVAAKPPVEHFRSQLYAGTPSIGAVAFKHEIGSEGDRYTMSQSCSPSLNTPEITAAPLGLSGGEENMEGSEHPLSCSQELFASPAYSLVTDSETNTGNRDSLNPCCDSKEPHVSSTVEPMGLCEGGRSESMDCSSLHVIMDTPLRCDGGAKMSESVPNLSGITLEEVCHSTPVSSVSCYGSRKQERPFLDVSRDHISQVCRTPEVPSVPATEPSPSCCFTKKSPPANTADVSSSECVVARTPSRGAAFKTQSSVNGGEDILDMLFMSSSQLESHIGSCPPSPVSKSPVCHIASSSLTPQSLDHAGHVIASTTGHIASCLPPHPAPQSTNHSPSSLAQKGPNLITSPPAPRSLIPSATTALCPAPQDPVTTTAQHCSTEEKHHPLHDLASANASSVACDTTDCGKQQAKKLAKNFSYPKKATRRGFSRSRVRSKRVSTRSSVKDKLNKLSVENVAKETEEESQAKMCVERADGEVCCTDNEVCITEGHTAEGDGGETTERAEGGEGERDPDGRTEGNEDNNQEDTDKCEKMDVVVSDLPKATSDVGPNVTGLSCEVNQVASSKEVKIPPSTPPPQRQMRAPGLRKSTRCKTAFSHPDKHQKLKSMKENGSISPPPPPPLTDVDVQMSRAVEGDECVSSDAGLGGRSIASTSGLGGQGFVGFKTASGGVVAISEAALERAEKLIGEDVKILKNVGNCPTDDRMDDRMDVSPVPLQQQAAAVCSPHAATSNTSTNSTKLDLSHPSNKTVPGIFSTSTPFRAHPPPHTSGSATLPHKKGLPRSRQRSKAFKAPRLASDVSELEEKASRVRILRNFGVKSGRGQVNSDPCVMASGFASAKGKNITISSAALLKAQKMLAENKENVKEKSPTIPSDVTSDGVFTTSTPLRDKLAASTPLRGELATCEDPRIPLANLSPLAEHVSKGTKVVDSSLDQFSMTGFKTAGGRGIGVSADAMKKAREIFDTCAEDDPTRSEQDTITGFSTAGGKGITISADAMKKAQELVDKCNQVEPQEGSGNTFTGFRTAGGKGVSVSADAIKKAQELLDRCNKVGTSITEQESGVTFTGFNTAGGKGITVSADAMKKAQELVDQCSNGDEVDPSVTEQENRNTFIGFKTAGGKGITVSADAMKKAQELIDECSGGDQVGAELSTFTCLTGFKTASGNALTVSRQSLEKARQAVTAEVCEDKGVKENIATIATSPHNNRESVCMTGFRTASGNALTVSCTSLENAKHVVEDDQPLTRTDDTDFHALGATESSVERLTGFKTASGNTLSVSWKSLEKARQIDEDKPQQSDLGFDASLANQNSVLTGFKTAGGNALSVSRKSLEKAKQVIEESEKNAEGETCDKKVVSPSLVRPTTHPDSLQTIPGACVTGFRTASGAVLTVSDKSLERGKLVLEDREKNRPDFIGDSSPNSPIHQTSSELKAMEAPRTPVEPDVASEYSDPSNCYFSTQVVRQFINFSSDDDEDDDPLSPSLIASSTAVPNTNSLLATVDSVKLETNSQSDSLRPVPGVEACVSGPTIPSNGSEGDEAVLNVEDCVSDQTISAQDSEDERGGGESDKDFYLLSESMIKTIELGLGESELADGDGAGCPMGVVRGEGESTEGERPVSQGPIANNDAVLQVGHVPMANESCYTEHIAMPKDSSSVCHPCATPIPPCATPTSSHILEQSPVTPSTNSVNLADSEEIISQLPNEASPSLLGHTCLNTEERSTTGLTASHKVDSISSSFPASCLDQACHGAKGNGTSFHKLDSTSPSPSAPLSSSRKPESISPLSSQKTGLAPPISPVPPRRLDPTSPKCDSTPSQKPNSTPHLPFTPLSSPAPSHKPVFTPPYNPDPNPPSNDLGETPGTCNSELPSPHLHNVMATSQSIHLHMPAGVLKVSEDQVDGGEIFKLSVGDAVDDRINIRQYSELISESQTASEVKGEDPHSAVIDQTESGKGVEGSSIADAGVELNVKRLQTASDKRVEVSDEAIRAVKLVLQDSGHGEKVELNTGAFEGLQTVGDMCIGAALSDGDTGENLGSSPSLNTSKIVGEEKEAVVPTVPVSFPAGLQTASGKKVELCDESLRAAKMDGSDVSHNLLSFPGLQTASGKAVAVTETSIRVALGDDSTSSKQSTSFPGLQTASGKAVAVSDESIKAARMALGDDSPSSVQTSSAYPGLQTASGKAVVVSDASIRAAKMALGDASVQESSVFPGLQTVNGKAVEISNDSIRVAKMTVKDDSLSSVQSMKTTAFPGLCTASGKAVEVSGESIRAAKMALGDTDLSSEQPKRSTSFPGLQTASGRAVEVRDDSIRAARMALGESSAQKSNTFPSLQTASGKAVEVRDEYVRAAKRTLEGTIKKPTSSFPGLQSASGKEVEIKDESLRAAKLTLGDDVVPASNSGLYPRLSTASGKRVRIAEESLREVLGSSTVAQPGSRRRQTASRRQVDVRPSSIRGNKRAPGSDINAAPYSAQQRSKQTSHDSRPYGVRAPQQELSRPPNRTTPEGILCDRTPAGKSRLVPLYSSVRTDNTSSAVAQRQPANHNTRKLQHKNLHVFGKAVSHREGTPPLSNPSVRPPRSHVNQQAPFRNRTISHPVANSSHYPRAPSYTRNQATPFVTHHAPPLAHGHAPPHFATSHTPPIAQSHSHTPLSHATSYSYSHAPPHSHDWTPISSRAGYTSTSKINFSTPVKGHSKSKSTCLMSNNVPQHNVCRRDDSYTDAGEVRIPELDCPLSPVDVGVVSEVRLPELDCPLSPLQVTLSQVCMMEQSQALGMTEVEEGRWNGSFGVESLRARQKSDDSGYCSREISAVKSPSPLEPESNCTRETKSSSPLEPELNCIGVISSLKSPSLLEPESNHTFLKRKRDQTHFESLGQREGCMEGVSELMEGVSDLLFAEVAIERLEDTLGSSSEDSQGSLVLGPVAVPGCVGGAEKRSPLVGVRPVCPGAEQVHDYDGHLTSTKKAAIPELEHESDESVGRCVDHGTDNLVATTSPTETGLKTLVAEGTCNHVSEEPNAEAVVERPVENCDTNESSYSSSEGHVQDQKTVPVAAVPEVSVDTSHVQESNSPLLDTVQGNCSGALQDHRTIASTENLLDTTSDYLPSSNPTIMHTPTTSLNKVASQLLDGAQSCMKPVPTPPTSTTGSVKPQLGSLLKTRLKHPFARMPLQDVVCRPPRRCDPAELTYSGVRSCVQNVRGHNAGEFRFSSDFFSSVSLHTDSTVCVGDGSMVSLKEGSVGVNELWEAFRTSPGVDTTLITFRWFHNHFRNLVSKLASMEVTYPEVLGGRCLTPDWLMLQMKYRYDREIDRAERSIIHKICEHDDLPSRRMVLFVSNYSTPLNNSLTSSTLLERSPHAHLNGSLTTVDNSKLLGRSFKEPKIHSAVVELSDGWYSLPCELDPPLSHMLKSGKITIGTKLMIYGAELVGLPSPCHPLDVPDACRLKIFANSTRRARWFTRLGYQPSPRPFPVPLQSLFAEGGRVGCVDVVIARVYPLIYLERDTKRMRCERVEQREVTRHRRERERVVERISSRVQREFENEVALQDCPPPAKRRRSRRLNVLQVKQLQDGEAIYTALLNAADPQTFQEALSHNQLVYLESYRLNLISQRQTELQRRIETAIQYAADSIPDREVTPLMKIRLVPVSVRGASRDGGHVSYQLSVWRPNAELMQLLKEGQVVRLINTAATQTKHKYDSVQLELTANRSTQFLPCPSEPSSLSHYHPRQCTQISCLGSSPAPPHREFDTVGVVVHVYSTHPVSHDLETAEQVIDMFCLADSDHGILVVKAWGGLKCYGLEEAVTVGATLALSNLSLKGCGPGYPWYTASLSNHTVVSQNPKDKHVAVDLARLQRELLVNRTSFMKEVTDTILTYL